MFEGFSQGTVDFLWGLCLNNERSWFQAHREEFHTLVDTPLRALAAQVGAAMSESYPKLGLEVKVSRIYRDARRLYGRGPYKDHLWFSLRRPSEQEGSAPSFYFGISAQCYSYGMGCYDPTPATMAKLRARIDRDPKPLARLARQVEQRGEFRLDGTEYKRPKGDPGPLLYPWYNRKQIDLCHDDSCEGIFFTPQLAEQVLEGFQFLVPCYLYLRDVTGDSAPV